MRKYFLLTACILTLLGTTNTYATEALFPDLAKRNAPKEEKATQPAKLFDTEVNINQPIVKEDDGFKEVETIKKPIEEPKKTEKNEKKEEAKNGFFEIHPHDITIITPPTSPSDQFCKGSLTLENQTKYNLKTIELRLQYGEVKINYAFVPVASGNSVTGNIFLLGKSCQNLAQTAGVEVKKCVAEGISNAECKQLVKYIVK